MKSKKNVAETSAIFTFTISKGLYLAALLCYAVSFFLPAFGSIVEGKVEVHDGYEAFMLSLMAPFLPFTGNWQKALVVWLANPAFWAGAVLLATGLRREALAASCAAISLACSYSFTPLVFAGYYIWMASAALLTLACAMPLLPQQFSLRMLLIGAFDRYDHHRSRFRDSRLCQLLKTALRSQSCSLISEPCDALAYRSELVFAFYKRCRIRDALVIVVLLRGLAKSVPCGTPCREKCRDSEHGSLVRRLLIGAPMDPLTSST